MVAVNQETGEDLDPSGLLQNKGQSRGRDRRENQSDNPPEIGSVHKARILSIRPFGAFVQIEGYRANGLVHVSQVIFLYLLEQILSQSILILRLVYHIIFSISPNVNLIVLSFQRVAWSWIFQGAWKVERIAWNGCNHEGSWVDFLKIWNQVLSEIRNFGCLLVDLW